MKTIKNSGLSDSSHIFQEFLDLLKTRFELESIIFSSAEVSMMFDKSIPEILLKLIDIVDGVKKYCSKIEGIKITYSKTNEEYGITFKTEQGEGFFWFSAWYPFWKEHKAPLSFGIYKGHPQEIVDKFTKLHRDEYIEFYEQYVCSIDKDIIARSDALETIAKLVEKEVKQLLAK